MLTLAEHMLTLAERFFWDTLYNLNAWLPLFHSMLTSLSYQYHRASFSGQKDADIKAYIETLVVLDKTVRDQFDSDSEAEKYVEVLLMLVSQ
jgi:hypothetical protein